MAQWALLTGPKGCGKSMQALEIVRRLREAGLRVEGFVQAGTVDALERKGYDLVRLRNEQRLELARPGSQERPGEEAFCSWVFRPSAFGVAREWALEDGPGADVIVVDEVSKLEAAGKGHHDVIAWGLGREDVKVMLLCVRADQLFWVMEKFGLEEEPSAMMEVPVDPEGLREFAEALLARCAGPQG